MEFEKTILITGAGGYIGRHVVKELLDRGYKVNAVDLNTELVDERAKKFSVNIFEEDTNIFQKLGSPDVCLHMAWQDGFIHNADSHIMNLPKHYTFVKGMIEGGLKHIAIMGTMHEIGYWEGSVDETTPCNPYSLYGIAKNSLRQAVEVLTKDKDIIIQWLRVFYIQGDDLKNNSIFKKIIELEKEGEKTFPFTTGENKYDFISVTELANQLVSSITQEEVVGIINCCSGEPISLRQKVEMFIEENNFKIKPQYGAYPNRAYDSPEIYGDNEKIKRILK